MMTNPEALVLAGDGINCEVETAYALSTTGFTPELVHVTDLLDEPGMIKKFKLMVIPGGFSFGDEIASGKVLALKLKDKFDQLLKEYVAQGSLLLGTCNGFQVLVQLGILPPPKDNTRVASLIHNATGRFVDRWVSLIVNPNVKCAFLNGLERFDLPVRHGEGQLKVAPGMESYVSNFACLRYGNDINGSFDLIAGLTNDTGNVFGLMPHPEAFVRWTQHPAWTSMQSPSIEDGDYAPKASAAVATLTRPAEPHGLAIFRSARRSLE
jgi:phosphoribosylformylglycinamidine synthase subunit PurQ / glutaminase